MVWEYLFEMDEGNAWETGFFKCEAIFLKVRLLTYKQIIAIKSLDVYNCNMNILINCKVSRSG